MNRYAHFVSHHGTRYVSFAIGTFVGLHLLVFLVDAFWAPPGTSTALLWASSNEELFSVRFVTAAIPTCAIVIAGIVVLSDKGWAYLLFGACALLYAGCFIVCIVCHLGLYCAPEFPMVRALIPATIFGLPGVLALVNWFFRMSRDSDNHAMHTDQESASL